MYIHFATANSFIVRNGQTIYPVIPQHDWDDQLFRIIFLRGIKMKLEKLIKCD